MTPLIKNALILSIFIMSCESHQESHVQKNETNNTAITTQNKKTGLQSVINFLTRHSHQLSKFDDISPFIIKFNSVKNTNLILCAEQNYYEPSFIFPFLVNCNNSITIPGGYYNDYSTCVSCHVYQDGDYEISFKGRFQSEYGYLWIDTDNDDAQFKFVVQWGDLPHGVLAEWVLGNDPNVNFISTHTPEEDSPYKEMRPLQFTYKITKPGAVVPIVVKANDHILPVYEVDCDGDGIYEQRNLHFATYCKYDKPGTYHIRLRGIILAIKHNCRPSEYLNEPKKKNFWSKIDLNHGYELISLDQWGDIEYHSLHAFFFNCEQARIKAKDTPNFTHLHDTSEMFRGTLSFNDPVNHWDMSHVDNAIGMFQEATAFNQPVDRWDVSHVVYMQNMFKEAVRFNQTVNTWDTSSVVNMTQMFDGASRFNQPMNRWNVSNVRYMSGMFIRTYRFNQPLDTWDVSHVEYMNDMFAFSRFNHPLDWNIASLKDARGIFEQCPSYGKYCKRLPPYRDLKFVEKLEKHLRARGVSDPDIWWNAMADEPYFRYEDDYPGYDLRGDVYEPWRTCAESRGDCK